MASHDCPPAQKGAPGTGPGAGPDAAANCAVPRYFVRFVRAMVLVLLTVAARALLHAVGL